MGVIDRLMTFLDSMDGGAWSHLVGAVICQVYSGNERDLGLVTSYAAYRDIGGYAKDCLLYTSPSPRDQRGSRMPSSA